MRLEKWRKLDFDLVAYTSVVQFISDQRNQTNYIAWVGEE